MNIKIFTKYINSFKITIELTVQNNKNALASMYYTIVLLAVY